ncbi:hypothetical protein SDC9_77336 [bioreactor metagenome]|uniref:Uncharacterized protein n=1 Tax=bioreactor metagenome TaxID=1076179 RepID=A0A644YQK7_9ZZZZ
MSASLSARPVSPQGSRRRAASEPRLPDDRSDSLAAGPIGPDGGLRGAVPDQMDAWLAGHLGAAHRDGPQLVAQPHGLQMLQCGAKPGRPDDRVQRGEAAIGLPDSVRFHRGEQRPAPEHAPVVRLAGVLVPRQTGIGDHASGRAARLDVGPHLVDGLPSALVRGEAVAEFRYPPGVPEGGGHPRDLRQMLDRRDPATDDRDSASGEVSSPCVVVGVQLPAGEGGAAGDIGPDRIGPGAGRVDDDPRSPLPTVGLDDQIPLGVVIVGPDRVHQHRTQDRRVEAILESREVAWHGAAARLIGVDRRAREAGQIEDPVDSGHGQRLPAVPPSPTRAGLMVEDDEVAAGLREVDSAHETAPQQVIGSR